MPDQDSKWDYVDGMLVAAGVDPDARWIDAHSVTCALCGGYADERESVKLRDRDGYPEGEAHATCFEYAEENGVRVAQESLDPLVVP
jgi:hypothetical protein